MKYIAYVVASLLAAAFVGWMLGNTELMVVVSVGAWIAFGISKIPSGTTRFILSTTALLLVVVGLYKGWFSNHMPLTKSTLATLPGRIDVSMAKATFDAGVSQDSGVVEVRQVIDSLHNQAFQRKLGVLTESVRQGLITPDSALKILNDSLEVELNSYQAAQAHKAFRKASTRDDSKHVKVTYNVYDKNQDIIDVPPHSKVVLTATTQGYTCDKEAGVITTADGLNTFVYDLQFRAGFPVTSGRVFCLLGRLGNGELKPFQAGECVLFNNSNSTVTASVELNERNDWSDNVGQIVIEAKIDEL